MDILIVKMSSLGDIIHAFPVVQFLKQHDPSGTIDWVVERPFAELVEAHPYIDQVFTVQTKKWRSNPFSQATWKEVIEMRRALRRKPYQLVLDLQGNVKSAFITSLAKSSKKVGFGYSTVHEWPNIFVTHRHYNPPLGVNIRDDYLFLAQSACSDFSPLQEKGIQLKVSLQDNEQLDRIWEKIQKQEGLKIIVCPGSNWSNKQLSTSTMIDFLQLILKKLKAHLLFLWGHKGEKELAEQLSLAFPEQSSVVDKLSLAALQNLMSRANLVIAMDSLPLHLAGTTATPTFSVFGASLAKKFKPVGPQHHAFQGNCPYGQSFPKRCEILRTCKTGACIKSLEGRQLYEEFCRWWRTNW